MKLKTLSFNNSNEFWNYLKKLGPRKINSVPVKVKIGHEVIKAVLNKWLNDYSSSYNYL